MMLSRTADKYVSGQVTYKLMENHVVDMPNAGLFSYSIIKVYAKREWEKDTAQSYHKIIDGIKNRDAVMLIWEDVKAGIQH